MLLDLAFAPLLITAGRAEPPVSMWSPRCGAFGKAQSERARMGATYFKMLRQISRWKLKVQYVSDGYKEEFDERVLACGDPGVWKVNQRGVATLPFE